MVFFTAYSGIFGDHCDTYPDFSRPLPRKAAPILTALDRPKKTMETMYYMVYK